jgi:centrosomal protein CEP19
VIGKISKRQLQRLLQHLVEHQKKTNVNLLPQVQQLPQADYNRVSEVQLKQVKNRMDVVFQQNLLKPGDEEYVYDKQVDFQAPQKKSEWDDED